MGFFKLVGSLIGSGAAKKASRKAESAQLEYLNKALGEQQRQFEVTRQDYAPLLSLLAPSVAQLGNGTGINGAERQQEFLTSLQNSPLLESLYRTGTEGVLQNASATGGLRGGNTQRGLADFRADTFAGQFDAQLARLAGLAGLGSGATQAVSTFGANASDNISNLYGQQGQVRAGGITTRGGINAQNWNDVGSGIEDAIKAIFAGGGG